MSDEQMVPVFIPALITILLHEEQAAGRPLTEEEVLAVRDRGVCMMMRLSDAQAMDESRGYDDIDPSRAWEEWSVVRERLVDE